MFSQSLPAQLFRMLILLALTLVAVHHSESLMALFAGQAMNSGCHQQGNQVEEHHLHHNQSQHNQSSQNQSSQNQSPQNQSQHSNAEHAHHQHASAHH